MTADILDLALLAARADLYSRAACTPAYVAYLRQHDLDLDRLVIGAGITALLPVVDCGHGRFEFGVEGDDLGFACEVIGDDGESIDDIVAWPVTDPANVMTLLGRTGIIGLWDAFNPATYYLGKPLVMHRTPLDWLKAGCRGAAIADKRIAARQFLDLPGRVAGRDQDHGRELLAIAELVVDQTRFVIPVAMPITERAAA